MDHQEYQEEQILNHTSTNKLLKYFLIGTLIILLSSTISLASDNTQVLSPIEMGSIASFDTNTTRVNHSTTWESATSLFACYDTAARISTIYMQWNLSEIPFNVTITAMNLSFGANKTATSAGGHIYFGSSHFNSYLYPNESNNEQLRNQYWSPGPVYNFNNADNCSTDIIYPTLNTLYFFNYTYLNKSFNPTPATGETFNASLESNISRGWFVNTIYISDSGNNITVPTQLNPFVSKRPKLTVNYSYTASYVNSTISNNSHVQNGFTYYYNITNPYSNRSKYCLYLYNKDTGVQTTLLNYSRTAFTGTSYNQSCTYVLNSLTPDTHYLIWCRVIGNTSFVMDAFDTVVPFSTNITVYPINEGYIHYDSNLITYNKYTPWANGTLNLLETFTPSGNSYDRMFFEWNISHYIPVDAIINSVNFTYWASNRYWTGGAIADHDFCFIAKKNDNTTNASNAQSLYNEIYDGPSMSNADMDILEWFDTNIMFNRSTYNYAGYPVTQEGCWWLPGTALGRSIRDALADNISTSRDRLIMGSYSGVTGGVLKEHALAISSTLNTSAMTRPYLYINCTYNMTESNGSSFTNNSNTTTQPLVSFNISNPLSTYISVAVNVYDTVLGTTTETYFNRRATNGTLSIYLTNITCFGREYYWYYYLVGNSTYSPIYHLTTEYPFVTEPDNVTCHDYNTTVLNFSFNPYNHTNGTTYTVCYYSEGLTAPTYGTGTLGGNVSSTDDFRHWINITGLTRGTTYTFAFWSFWNDTAHSYSMLSDNATILTNRTGWGEVNFTLRFENTSTDGTNHYINLSHFNSSRHKLIIYYTSLTSDIVYFDSESYNTSNFIPCITQTIKEQPYMYELIWNETTNGTSRMCTYSRKLTQYAEETSGGETRITFYLITDTTVYNQYYLSYDGNYSNFTLEEDIDNRLVEYNYLYEDNTGIFSSTASTNNYVTIYSTNTTKRLIIDQRYWDASHQTTHVLLYDKLYFISINSTTNPTSDFDPLGNPPTGRTTSPYSYTIIIMPKTEESKYITAMTQTAYGWSHTATGLWFHYLNLGTSNGINVYSLNFTVYNSTGVFFYSKEVLHQNGYDFNFTTANKTHNYTLVLRFVLYKGTNYTTYTATFPIYPNMTALATADYAEIVLGMIFGDPFIYNVDTGEELSIMNFFVLIAIVITMFICIEVDMYEILAFAPVGVIGLSSMVFSGLSPIWIPLAIFSGVLGLLYLLMKGARGR